MEEIKIVREMLHVGQPWAKHRGVVQKEPGWLWYRVGCPGTRLGGPLGGDFRPWSLSSAVEQRLAAAPCRWLPNNFGVDSKLWAALRVVRPPCNCALLPADKIFRKEQGPSLAPLLPWDYGNKPSGHTGLSLGWSVHSVLWHFTFFKAQWKCME